MAEIQPTQIISVGAGNTPKIIVPLTGTIGVQEVADKLDYVLSVLHDYGLCSVAPHTAPVVSAGGAHPDLAIHDGLGLATDAELTAHAATSHGVTAHGSLTGVTADQHHVRQHAATSAGDHTFPGGTSNFLRADGTFAAPPADGGGPTIVVKELIADFASPGTSMGKVTGLDQSVDVGTWWFEYRVIWRTTVVTDAIKLGVNFAGTQTLFVVEATHAEATTAASTGVADQVHAAFGLRAGGSGRVSSSTVSIYGPTAADTANADMMVIVKGVIRVTALGDLQLYFGSELTAVQTCKAGSALRLTKVSA